MVFRADLLDLIASACRRGAPVGPIVAAAASPSYRSGRERRLLEQMAARLDEGAPLSEAFAGLGRRIAPPHVVHAIEAAEGTSRLPAVLESVAADTGEAIALRHQLRLALLYPVLLTVLVLGLHQMCIRILGSTQMAEITFFPVDSWPARLALGLVLAAGAVVVGLLLLDRLDRLPGTRRLAQARLLSTSALLLEAGLPLSEALRRAARVAGRKIGGDEEPSAMWDALGLPASDRVRLAAAGSRLPTVLSETAARCLDRWRRKSEIWLQWLKPATILIVGGLVLIDFMVVFGFLRGVLGGWIGGESLW